MAESPNIKLVLTDMDGTIVQFGKHEVSQRVRDSVIACENMGVTVAPVTGRDHLMAQAALDVLGFDGPGVFNNGATIQDIVSGNLLYKKWLEPEKARSVATILHPHAKSIYYESGLPLQDISAHPIEENEVARIAAVNDFVTHVFAVVFKNKADQIEQDLQHVPGISFYMAPAIDDDTESLGIQVTHEGADKFHGVTALRAITGIAKEHTLAIGDGTNDLPLFRNAGIKVAMGNASDELKAAADYVVGSVDEDGFAEAMERFVLS